jgi:hypothetical protein
MSQKGLEQNWEKTRGFLEAAAKLLPPSISQTDERLARYREWFEHNELELAYDELKGIGDDMLLPGQFWEALKNAAISMGLPEQLDVTCVTCGKVLAIYDPQTDKHHPTGEELFASGAVPVPNFGWFCTQACGSEYEKRKGQQMFQRDADGNIRYYPEPA